MSRTALLVATALTLSPALADADDVADASLSWQLRPVTIGNASRIDSAAAAFDDHQGNLDLAVATTWTGSYRLTESWAPTVRLGLVGNNAPGAALDGSSFANPLLGATYARAMGAYRLAVFAGATLPLGTGNSKTHTAAMTARPADRALFDVDRMAGIGGVDVAYVNRGLTVQGEATLAQSIRVRGDEMSSDAASTRASFGAHVGYVVGWGVSVAAELHYEDTLTASVGMRKQIELGSEIRIHPGIAVLRGLGEGAVDAPLITAQTTAFMLDLPVTF